MPSSTYSKRDRGVRTGLCLRACIPFGGQEPRLRNRRSGLCGDAGRDLLVFRREHADLRVSEEEPADNGAVRDEHWNREVASNGEVPGRHPVVRRIAAEARVDRDIVEPDDRRAFEGRAEDVCRARHRKAREFRPRNARDRVEGVLVAVTPDDVVEERPELSADDFRRLVGHDLDDLVEIVLARDRLRNPIQGLDDALLTLELGKACFETLRRGLRRNELHWNFLFHQARIVGSSRGYGFRSTG